jgi:RimJ/RimL family protein N-acetyltransferase
VNNERDEDIPQPVLRTPRLVLRPFTFDDASAVHLLAGAAEVANTTLYIPHPYPPEAAEQWIVTHSIAWEDGMGATYAVTDAATDTVTGALTLVIAPQHARAEIGYWIGVPFWNRGYCTEAARAVMDLAFRTLRLHRVQAHHLTRNPASGRVMQKLGMKLEGVHRGALRKNGRFEDLAVYGILADEWSGEPAT